MLDTRGSYTIGVLQQSRLPDGSPGSLFLRSGILALSLRRTRAVFRPRTVARDAWLVLGSLCELNARLVNSHGHPSTLSFAGPGSSVPGQQCVRRRHQSSAHRYLQRA